MTTPQPIFTAAVHSTARCAFQREEIERIIENTR
jgi:hypothetical protein